jgi:cytochrome c553
VSVSRIARRLGPSATGTGNTAIDALAIDPADAARWYAATSTSIFRSTDGGSHWEPFGQGLPALSEAVGYKSLAIEPQPNGRIWLGTEGGLFFRDRAGDRWVSDPDLGSARVTVVACDPRDRRIYVGTIKQGVYVGTAGAWRRVGDAGWFVSRIVVHPREASRVYLATRGAGVFASDDEGATWTPLGKGLSDADVRSLAVHPANPARLAVGTTSSGIFYSHDGGASWHAASRVARLTMSQIVAMLTPAAPRGDARPIPPAFAKCSRCHGWTDERLNEKHTYWRVPPNPRNWAPAVDRMAARAELTDAERTDITRFLTVYSGRPLRDRSPVAGGEDRQTCEAGAAAPTSDQAALTIISSRCGACHGVTIGDRCAAGDCAARSHAIEPRPWHLVLRWMQAMGCRLR